MIILTVLAIMLVIGILLTYTDYDDFGLFVMITAVVLHTLFVVIFLTNYHSTKANILRFKATELTIKYAVEKGNRIENAALLQKSVEQNQWLAGVQYWNETLFDICIPDEVMDLTPINID